MGRKRTREVKPTDRIGEEVDLEKCPVCTDHPDCFSYMEGRCTALKSADEGCAFYKPEEKAISDCRKAYRHLKKTGRYDLIQKYSKLFTAMGFLDEDLEEENLTAKRIASFKDADFKALMTQVPGFS